MSGLFVYMYFGALFVAGIGGVFSALRIFAGKENLRVAETSMLVLSVLMFVVIGALGIHDMVFMAVYVVSAVAAFMLMLRSLIPERIESLSYWAVFVALLVMSAFEIYLWQTLDRPPFQFLGETFVWLALLAALLLVITEKLQGIRGIGQFAGLLILAFLAFTVVWPDLKTKELPPALQSAWFVPHVLVYLLGYGALTLAFITAVGYLVAERMQSKLAKPMGDASYKLVSLGFPFLTAGLAFGAFWGQNAWGSYWAWDPKENWALVTWIVYLMYLHLRFIRNWNRSRAAWFLVLGVVVIFITYLAVSYLPTARQSVHTYTG